MDNPAESLEDKDLFLFKFPVDFDVEEFSKLTLDLSTSTPEGRVCGFEMNGIRYVVMEESDLVTKSVVNLFESSNGKYRAGKPFSKGFFIMRDVELPSTKKHRHSLKRLRNQEVDESPVPEQVPEVASPKKKVKKEKKSKSSKKEKKDKKEKKEKKDKKRKSSSKSEKSSKSPKQIRL